MGWIKNIFKKDTTAVSTPSVPNFAELCKTIKVDDSRIVELKLLKEQFKKNLDRYKVVSQGCNSFPVDLMFALHYRESSLDFRGVLHNGERILGTGKKTKLVPANRGPFNSWEEAAVDALLLKKSIFPGEWTFEARLAFAEKFNGLGYRKRGIFSPYVFAGTNAYIRGKYVADGKFSATAMDKQLGVASILLELNEV